MIQWYYIPSKVWTTNNAKAFSKALGLDKFDARVTTSSKNEGGVDFSALEIRFKIGEAHFEFHTYHSSDNGCVLYLTYATYNSQYRSVSSTNVKDWIDAGKTLLAHQETKRCIELGGWNKAVEKYTNELERILSAYGKLNARRDVNAGLELLLSVRAKKCMIGFWSSHSANILHVYQNGYHGDSKRFTPDILGDWSELKDIEAAVAEGMKRRENDRISLHSKSTIQ